MSFIVLLLDYLTQIYYQNSKLILATGVIAFILFTIVIKLYCSNDTIINKFNQIIERCRELLEKELMANKIIKVIGFLFSEISIVLLLVFGAVILRMLGIVGKIPDTKLPVYIAIMGLVILAAVFVIMLKKYCYNKIEIVKMVCRYIKALILGECLLLAVFANLGVSELVVASILLCCCRIIEDMNIKEKSKSDCSCMSDTPIQDYKELFESRQIQLNNLIKELSIENRDQEPFAMAISAPWGYGKTSFMKCFEQKWIDGEFVWINVGFECEVIKILEDIEVQLEKIFEKNKVYMGKRNPIEKYFKCIIDFLGETDLKAINSVLGRLGPETNYGLRNNKEIINECLQRFSEQTHKKIFIIIDDFERCMPETREKIFGVIYESINLKNCTTIFLSDFDKITTPNVNREYFEKYIHKVVNLCGVSFREIAKYYEQKFLSEDFLIGKSEYITENTGKLKKNFIFESEQVLKRLEDYYESEKNVITKKGQRINEDYIEVSIKKMNLLQNAISRVEMRMCNPRKVKRYMQDGIQRLIQIADTMWFSNSNYEKNEYSNKNWMKIILQVSFVKYFLEEEYSQLLNYSDLYGYMKTEDSYIVSLVIDDFHNTNIGSDNSVQAIVEMLVYKDYVFDSKNYLSEKDSLLRDLKNDSIKENRLKDCIEKTMGWGINIEIIEKVLDFIIRHGIQNTEIFFLILEKITKTYQESEDMLRVQGKLRGLADMYLENCVFRDREMDKLQAQIEDFEEGCILWNRRYVYWILRLLGSDVIKLDEIFNFNIFLIKSVDDLVTKLDEVDAMNYDFTNRIDERSLLKGYFKDAFKCLEDAKYDDERREIKICERHINCFLKFLDIWSDDKLIIKMKKEIDSLENAIFYGHKIENAKEFEFALKKIENQLMENDERKNDVIVSAFWKSCTWLEQNLYSIEIKEELLEKMDSIYCYIRDNAISDYEEFYSIKFRINEMKRKISKAGR